MSTRIELRIVAGSLRGRKLTCVVSEKLRPAPQMVREALFSILGDSVPGRPFYDLFAGTGAVGIEALSREASRAVFVERDFRFAEALEKHLQAFDVAGRAAVLRADVYRWAERWPGESEPANVFIGPPYPDFQRRFDNLVLLIADLQRKLAPGSVLVLQSEDKLLGEKLPGDRPWKTRRYGRNVLLIYV